MGIQLNTQAKTEYLPTLEQKIEIAQFFGISESHPEILYMQNCLTEIMERIYCTMQLTAHLWYDKRGWFAVCGTQSRCRSNPLEAVVELIITIKRFQDNQSN